MNFSEFEKKTAKFCIRKIPLAYRLCFALPSINCAWWASGLSVGIPGLIPTKDGLTPHAW